MVWVALGHMYMIGIEYPVIMGFYGPFARNRLDCENVNETYLECVGRSAQEYFTKSFLSLYTLL